VKSNVVLKNQVLYLITFADRWIHFEKKKFRLKFICGDPSLRLLLKQAKQKTLTDALF
jgi:hypothetical protein